MFEGLTKSKFYKKCESLIKTTKSRLEELKKKKSTVVKFLKNDMVYLLRNGYDYIAYTRAEWILVEQRIIACCDFIDQFCTCISSNLSAMSKQKECLQESKEAVQSLIYAAARFAEFPELRDLRALFTKRYGDSLESFVNKEFVETVSPKPATKEMKLQLLHDIAEEFSIEWDPKSLEQKLFNPPPTQQDQHKNESVNNSFTQKDVAKGENPMNDSGFATSGLKNASFDRLKLQSISNSYNSSSSSSSSEDEGNSERANPSSAGRVPEIEVENKKPFYYKNVHPPYVISKADQNKEVKKNEPPTSNYDLVDGSKWKPKSVRRRSLKLPEDPEQGSRNLQENGGDELDEEERLMDGLLKHYSMKSSPYKSNNAESSMQPPPWQMNDDYGGDRRHKNIKSDELSLPPGITLSTPVDPITETDSRKGHVRAASLQPEILAGRGHLHHNPPDFDELAARVAALRGGHVRAASLPPEILAGRGHVHHNPPDFDELAARVAALRRG